MPADIHLLPGSPALLIIEGRRVACAIGRAGTIPAASKQEGDGATPEADLLVRGVLLRPDSGFSPPANLPWRWLRPADGWSDDPRDPAYNRPVVHPHPFSAEWLWRDDGLYDAILVLGWNDDPPRPGAGSAIFWHLARPDYAPTEGCIAVARSDLLDVLPRLAAGMTVRVHSQA
jgi:L,D-peptidoglycan transpeptidase YkuD (ErfK/YbiS/YcfS/YnhG family)